MKRTRIMTLEPLAPAFLLVVFVHAALGLGIWWWWQNHQLHLRAPKITWMSPSDFRNLVPTVTPPVPKALPIAQKATPQKNTVEPPVAKATLIAMPQSSIAESTVGAPLFAGAAVPKQAASRSITMRRATPKAAPSTAGDPPAPPFKAATLADMARLNTLRPVAPVPAPAVESLPVGLNMDAIENAVNAAFYASWIAPPIESVPVSQRSAQLTISIARDGRVVHTAMSQPSGSHVLDDSILTAASKVTQLSVTLPSQFPKDSYDLELNFLLLP